MFLHTLACFLEVPSVPFPYVTGLFQRGGRDDFAHPITSLAHTKARRMIKKKSFYKYPPKGNQRIQWSILCVTARLGPAKHLKNKYPSGMAAVARCVMSGVQLTVRVTWALSLCCCHLGCPEQLRRTVAHPKSQRAHVPSACTSTLLLLRSPWATAGLCSSDTHTG